MLLLVCFFLVEGTLYEKKGDYWYGRFWGRGNRIWAKRMHCFKVCDLVLAVQDPGFCPSLLLNSHFVVVVRSFG